MFSTSNFINPSNSATLLPHGLSNPDQFTFRKLYVDYSSTLLKIIYKIVKHDEEAEDLLQETFMKIFNNFYLYDASRATIYTWMAKIARNMALDHIKSASIKNNSKNIDLFHAENVCVNYNVETIGLKKLVFGLTVAQKEIIDLMYFHGFTQAQVAEELNIPLGTVKTKARAAILILRKFFAN